MTLTDREYQHLRDLAIGIIREVGVDTGGCNIQFAVNPADGRIIVIEMNPRVSRSSALASKATGFPIAKIAAKVAIGYTLDEIPNDITAARTLEPAGVRADPRLRRGEGPAVRVREVPGRRHDADDPHEVGRRGDGDRPQLHRGAAARRCARWELDGLAESSDCRRGRLTRKALLLRSPGRRPTADQVPSRTRSARGVDPEEIHEPTGIDPWFLDQLELITRSQVGAADELARRSASGTAYAISDKPRSTP